MALLSSSCFFCSKNLPTVNDPFTKVNDEERLIGLINSSDSTESRVIISKKNLYQISHYLKLPKSQIDQYNLPPLTICQNCQEISQKLSKLCSDLEVMKMKINYYLNLLTDQLLSELPTHNNYQEDNQSNISSFQQMFQEKCLTTLSRTNVNPQLILTKCPSQPINFEEQLILEDDLMEDDYQVNYQDNYEDQLTVDQDEKLTGQLVNQPTRKLYDRSSRKCEYCDKMISYTNMSTHRKTVHGISATGYRPNKPFHYSKLKERVGCEYCGRMLSYRNLSTHKKYYCAVKLKKVQVNGRRGGNVRLNEKEKFEDKPENVKQLLQTCEHCGQVVLREKFAEHEQLWCPVTKGNVIINYEDEGLNLEGNLNADVKMEQNEEYQVEVQL